jgi:hypothetical protein
MKLQEWSFKIQQQKIITIKGKKNHKNVHMKLVHVKYKVIITMTIN